jgi:hypothetical protein
MASLYEYLMLIFGPTEYNLLNAGWLSWLYIDVIPYIRSTGVR